MTQLGHGAQTIVLSDAPEHHPTRDINVKLHLPVDATSRSIQYSSLSRRVVFPYHSKPVKSGIGDCLLKCADIIKNQVNMTPLEINKAPIADLKEIEIQNWLNSE